ncbi:Hsp20/alpha crystallin family protein [Desulfococcus multivorans]|uniref:Heat shock protein Hsp20 n=1 Tax=Desulfococcus multivorans DSM 2059 TaxID=1121405 RepID=S7T7I3_DESML|nr:Hsp20/alpha crystallin family protein [Desulfococcus multivorans]AOY60509.1 heat shock protein, Hsp 20 family [Desulfococcus multivorans]AQV02607.1 heat-shock protein Hsp20 [Desulfococcus multivorans]EPR32460.1 heat shock protein Hsp20 [Desulfococcus multivorans DSM 2059]SKA24544.1 Molecular chaperone IbpA, HSP20 family [Desulfococcus multivorans DSM 2059]
MSETRELQVREKQEVNVPAEQTRPGLVFSPLVDIFETDKEIVLLADMPGVSTDNLDVDLRENILTLSAEVVSGKGENEQDILKEYAVGKFYRQFTLSEVIDQSRIEAKLTNGVLRLVLPKVEKATPRKISITS